MYCNPDKCPHCLYIGEGDSVCDLVMEIVLDDWIPTEYYMGPDCPYTEHPRRNHRRHRRNTVSPQFQPEN